MEPSQDRAGELFCFLDASRPCSAECVAYRVIKEGFDPSDRCVALYAISRLMRETRERK